MFQKKGRNARFRFPVDDSPIDRRRPAILRQQGSMQVEGAQTGHVPHHLGKHAEGHHNLQIGLPCTQGLQESLIFQFLRLK